MIVHELIHRLNALKIHLQLAGNQLKIEAPEGTLTPELLNQLKEKKEELVGFLKIVGENVQYSSIPLVEKKEYYVLSYTQKRLYILQQLELKSIAYNMPQIIPLHDEPDIIRLKETFAKLLNRHESLRTSFPRVNDMPVQRVHHDLEFEIENFNLATGVEERNMGRWEDGTIGKEASFGKIDAGGEREGETAARSPQPETALISSFSRPFDLSRAPLLRVGLVKIAEDRHYLLTDMHHIISDGVSQELLQRDFSHLFPGDELPPLRLQYKDFSQWQQGKKEIKKIKQQESYWLREFEGELPVLNLPTDYHRPVAQSFEGIAMSFAISAEESRGLKERAAERGTTLFIVVLSIFNLLLMKLTGQEDIIVGTPVAGRTHADLEEIIGMFVNTLALRNFPGGKLSFQEFLGKVNARTLEAFENQEYPFEELVEKVEVVRDIGRNPIFDVMFSLQNQNSNATPKTSPHNGDTYTHRPGSSKFDMTLTALDPDRNLEFVLTYNTALFSKETIERFAGYFKNIISAVIAHGKIKCSHIPIMPAAERNRVLYQFNNTKQDMGLLWDKTIHRIFEEQVERTPDYIAVIDSCTGRNHSLPLNEGSRQLTYRELNKKAGQLARLLGSRGMGGNDAAAIMTYPCIEMMMGILALLKCGSCYLPLDPMNPDERLKYLLTDSEAALLLTHSHLTHQANFPIDSLNMDDEDVYAGEGDETAGSGEPGDCLYMIYTSGTTGTPKGVRVIHRNMVNYIHWFSTEIRLTCTDKTVLTSSAAFDLGYTSIYPSLLQGAQLHLLSKEAYMSSESLLGYICRQGITYLKMTPSFFSTLLIHPDFSRKTCRRLRLAVLGGEAINPEDVEKAYRLCGHLRIMNHYGPTEVTVGCIARFIEPDDLEMFLLKPTIGKPIYNTEVYILDKYLQVLPPGMVGELCLGGAGVAGGYFKREALTREKFIELEGIGSGKIYRTGDLAHWLPDGQIEFLGRLDTQVKIRGYRVEVGEIENRLKKHPKIKDAAILDAADPHGGTYLCAYIVTGITISELSTQPPSFTQLKDYLARFLPDYMIPAYFVPVEKIPLTPNGKTDRKALPKPGLKAGENYAAPRNKIERKLIELWSDVLKIERDVISIDSSFFRLGGHSLAATILATKIHKELKVKLPLLEIFKTPSIRGLSKYIRGTAVEMYESIRPVEKKEYHGLSSAQKRLYILQEMDLAAATYNMPEFIPLSGESNIENLEEACKKLINRHESLRTSFHMIGDQPLQKVHDGVEFKIEYYENLDAGNFVRTFDLSAAPLLRVGYVKAGEGKCYLLVDMHHIISDGISHLVLRSDFMSLYRGEELPALRIQYKDFAQWQDNEQQKSQLMHQEAYWLKEFASEIPVLNLPTDYPRPRVQSFAGNNMHFEIYAAETGALKRLSLESGATLFMVTLGVYNVFLAKLSSQEEITIGSPIAGRRHENLENIIGMFVNTLTFRNYPVGEMTFIEFLQQVKQRALEAYENQDYQFEELVENISLKRDVSRNPLFDVMFVLHNLSGGNGNIIEPMEEESIKPYNYDYKHRTAKFDLTLTVVEGRERLYLSFEYCTALFKEETVRRFILYFKTLISRIIETPDLTIAELEIISESEKQQLLYDFNETAAAYPGNQTIHQLFKEQVERTPDHIALLGGHEKNHNMSYMPHMSYKELNEKSHQSAGLLIEQGVKPDTIVGIMVERSVEMIIGIMGILKSGCAYLPIDPGNPEERINYMLTDSSAKVLLTTSNLAKEDEKLRSLEVKRSHETIFIDIIDASNPSSSQLLNFSTSPSSLAYVIYTSGSTGKPKGVMIKHCSLVNTLFALFKEYPFSERDAYLFKTSYVFDVSLSEIFGWFWQGGRLAILEKDAEKDPGKILGQIERNNITHINFVPSMFNAFVENLDDQNISKLSSLRYIFLAGEELLPSPVQTFKKFAANILLENIYGPTEATIYASKYSLQNWKSTGRIPIGKPLQNMKLYILDKHNGVQPIGMPGELCIAGLGLARGYLNNPELTEQKFCLRRPGGTLFEKTVPPGPPCKNFLLEGTRGLAPLSERIYFRTSNRSHRSHRSYIYRTGDLARWLPDGNIEFLGRIDHQVKIRGYRIELGEIESRLLSHTEIKEALVVAREKAGSDQRYLVGYIVGKKKFDLSEPRAYLGLELPAYMIPSYFVQLESFPLTPNGKIDVKALPEPGAVSIPGENYVAPRNEIEEKLAGICNEVLGRNSSSGTIGIDDNFFQLGGNSLSLMQFTSKVNKAFKVEIPLVELFKNAKIREISKWILRNDLIKSKTEPLFIFNDNKPAGIFCFPHWIAYGIAYRGMATYFENTTFYSFNFIEAGERLREYFQLIIKFQEKGPYVLLGHSAGGILMFETAKELERQGYEVGDLIFLDVYADKKKRDTEKIEDIGKAGEDFNNHVLKAVEEMGLDSLKQDVLNKIRNYSNYFSNMVYMGVINANIHHIIAENRLEDESTNLGKFTTGNFKIYHGFGKHHFMLNPGNIEKNAKVIREIMRPSSNII